mmetsp:Transcript_3745/g.6385  ORF Transcript_3745/g.6385 Transcript_3745/m.6385 type:complete len:146 (+) Transcript_3745:498-935(+)
MPDGSVRLSAFKMILLGILWCEGSNIEKVNELYLAVQEDGNEKIACSDKDFVPVLSFMLKLSTELTFSLESKIREVPRMEEVTDSILSEVGDSYPDIFEDFLDQVFGYDSSLTDSTWKEMVVEKQSYIFSPKLIRKELFKNHRLF